MLGRLRRVSGRVRWANMDHRVRVTDGHEAEVKRAESRKPLNRFQRFFLRVLGLRGEVAPQTGPERHAGPPHKHPVRHEHPTHNETHEHSAPADHQTKRDD